LIEQGLLAIGKAISAWATAWGFVYVTAIIGKTFLIYFDKGNPETLKDWFKFFDNKSRKL
jgi:hypothetical protein